ncbi:MAG: glycosyltransferase family 2 protein [Deltaproteobacteria bacterium]|nr:glycosyltransferase family 2 protein [Deltaproteobacteria bacterium]
MNDKASAVSTNRAQADRVPISAFVITYNEEDHITACLSSLDFCDEVIVIDSFSTDNTVNIAKSLGAKVIQRKWPGYRDQKAFGLESVSNEWVLNLDADECVSEELRERILEILGREKAGDLSSLSINGYYINRVVHYLGRWWRRGGWYPEYRLRLFRKSQTKWGGSDPHEKPIVSGPTARIGGEIYHYTYRNMDEQFERLHRFSSIAAKDEFLKGRRCSIASLLLNPILRTLKFYVLKRGFREGKAGFIIAVTEGYYTFMKYAKLWEHEFNQLAQKYEKPINEERR